MSKKLMLNEVKKKTLDLSLHPDLQTNLSFVEICSLDFVNPVYPVDKPTIQQPNK